MKARTGIIISLLLTASIITGGVYLRQKEIDTSYKNAVALMHSGEYEAALTEFENANHNKFDSSYFLYRMRSGEIKRAYKNTLPLYSYALAHICYDNKKMDMAKDYIDLIPSDYGGELSEEIKLFKENFKTEYDEYIAEEARKEAEIERERREYYSTIIPFVGMSEKYISLTVMGAYHSHKSINIGKGTRAKTIEEYFWKTDAGNTILTVQCEDNKVTKVEKNYTTTQWTSDGKPIYTQKKAKISYSASPKKKTYNDDTYDVEDYYDAEDFYDDHYDDFYDYEEAEDYYNENGMW